MTIVFPNSETLQLALSSGLVPAAARSAPARCARRSDGSLVITPDAPLDAAELERLQWLGVDSLESDIDGERIAHWFEAVPLVRARNAETHSDQAPVLFELPRSDVADLAGEILRLGNDRQSFRLYPSADGRSVTMLMRVLGPPYFSLLRALDRNGSPTPRAYREHAPGVWIEIGWAHPLAERLRPAPEQMLLLGPPNRWRCFESGGFLDIYESLGLDAAPPECHWLPADNHPLEVPIHLAAGNSTERAELWVISDQCEERVDALVRAADPNWLRYFAFAIIEGGGRRSVVLRSRPGKQVPPIELAGMQAYRPFHRVPNLFLPLGTALQPPLSRETARRLLADDPERIVWLERQSASAFEPRSLPDDAFRPLSEWAEHIIGSSSGALTEWRQASVVEFGSNVGPDQHVERLRESRRSKAPRSAPSAKPAAEKSQAPPSRRAGPTRPQVSVAETPAVQATPNEIQVQLRAAEERFLEIEGPLESQDRLELWGELGRLNAALDHSAEAALCWMHRLWESLSAEPEIAWRWVESEHALSSRTIAAVDLNRLMPAAPATGAELRPLAAVLVWLASQPTLPSAVIPQLPGLHAYLNQHDRLLPVRAVWLVWHGLTRHSGDALALARVRDRLLDRLLVDGMNPERDLPTFLRFAGHRGGDRLRTLRERFERLRKLIHRWSGFSRGDGLQQTPAYIDLIFAFGNARLGEASTARALLSSASAALDSSGNEAHRFLLEAFRWRIEQILAGKPHSGPLPSEQLEYLEQIRREAETNKSDPALGMVNYVVQRMRRESLIVDPDEELDPYRHTKREHDKLLRELARLADIHEPRILRDGLRRLVSEIQSSRLPELRLRILADALQLSSRVGATLGGELLDKVLPLLAQTPESADPNVQNRRAVLVERALFFAVHFDRSDLVPTLTSQLEMLVGGPATSTVLESRSRLIGESLRSLRKCGLRDQTERLLEQLAAAADYDPTDSRPATLSHTDLERLRVLLHIAAAWLSGDRTDRARPILDRARATLMIADGLAASDLPLYVSVIAGYIAALARAPLAEAMDRTEELFTSDKLQRFSNTYTTSHYYSRFHLNIAETVALSLANEEFAIGPAARRWLDDDEYLVRRRIHRDVRIALTADN
jgi:hypothetical protein